MLSQLPPPIIPGSDAPLLDWHREDGDKNGRKEGNVVCTDVQQEQVEQSMTKNHVDHI